MSHILLLFLGMAVLACISCTADPRDAGDAEWRVEREGMISQIRAHGFTNEVVLAAMTQVRRHLFIPEPFRERGTAYGDYPCRIGFGQTISQPFIVAYMTDRLGLKRGEKVLEIGTGSGYQAAVLAQLGADVYTIEIIPELAAHAKKALEDEGYKSVHVLNGDGYKGWPEHAPFDAVIVTCAPDDVPQALVDQLAEGGRMILPVGVEVQRIVILRKQQGRVTRADDLPVRFVPMVRGRR